MRNRSFKNVVALENYSIKDVMRIIDLSGLRVAYIVDQKNKLIGAVSDGEIRRAIIKGKDVNSPVRNIINCNPVVLKENDLTNIYKVRKRVKKLLTLMPDSRYIPLTNNDGLPLKLLSCSNLLGQKRYANRITTGKGKSVLVVGGAGYLGSVLVRRLLSSGFKVKVLDMLMYGASSIEQLLNNDQFELIEGDMRNISILVRALYNVDSVINLAAIVGDPACDNKPEGTIETNYLANKVLAEACKYHQINRFIYSSTCSVYGVMDGTQRLDETSTLNPLSLYARSKIQSEEGILALEDENFSPTILRMGTLYGYSPRMRFDLVVNTMIKSAVIDKKITVFNGGNQWRPLLNVDDAAWAFVKCLKSPLNNINGEIFNVGSSSQNYKIVNIAKTVKRLIPTSKLIIQGEANDLRNYRVSFAKIEKKLRYKSTNRLEESAKRIKKAIEKGEIKDVNAPKYYNVENRQ